MRICKNFTFLSLFIVLFYNCSLPADDEDEGNPEEDNNILKLDTIDTDYIRLTDRPTGHYDVRKIIKGMKAFKGNLIIQTAIREPHLMY